MVDLSSIIQNIEKKDFNSAIKQLSEFDYSKLSLAEVKEIDAAFRSIPNEIRRTNSIHLVQSCYICRMLEDQSGFDEWFKSLVNLREAFRGNAEEQNALESRICRVNIMSPKTTNAQLLILLSTLSNEKSSHAYGVPCESTMCRPSVLRGNIDCSEWGKYHKAVKSILTPIFEFLSDFDGKSAVDLGVGELYLEKGDYNGALMSLGTAINTSSVEIKYGANYALARMHLFEGEVEQADEKMKRAVAIVTESNAYWLNDNLKASLADIAILKGDNKTISEWLNEFSSYADEKILPSTAFIHIIRAKALMSRGEWKEATLLLQGLTDYFESTSRPFDCLECKILCSISLMQLESDDKAVELFHSAIKFAKNYGYTTVFADKGKLAFRLIGKYQKAYSPENGDAKFVAEISEQTKNLSLILPGIFDSAAIIEDADSEPPSLTDMEVRILQMIDDGASNKAIGVDLQIKLTTVKFHVKNIFEKFDVASRVELLKKARSYKILS